MRQSRTLEVTARSDPSGETARLVTAPTRRRSLSGQAATPRAAATVANAAKLLIVGDFGYYLIVDRIGMVVEVVPHLFATANNLPSGQRGLLAYWRNTGKVLSANAFRALTGTT
jgi:HK97 family phage major capsid protein